MRVQTLRLLPPAQHRLGLTFEVPKQRRDWHEQLARKISLTSGLQASVHLCEFSFEAWIDQRRTRELETDCTLSKDVPRRFARLAHGLGDHP